MKLRKVVSWLLTTVVATTSVSATGFASGYSMTDTESVVSDSKKETVESSSQDKLTILSWESNSEFDLLAFLFRSLNGYTNEQVEVKHVGSSGQDAKKEYEEYLNGNGDADLIIMDGDWIREYTNSDLYTTSLSSIGINESDYCNAFPYTLEIGKNDYGVLKAASYEACVGGFLYRADLAQKYLNVNNPDEMQELVKDWDSFSNTALKLYISSGGDTNLQSSVGGMYKAIIGSNSSPWVINKNVQVNKARHIITQLQEVNNNGAILGVPMWSDEWIESLQTGLALGEFVPSWGLLNTNGSLLYNFSGAISSGGNVYPLYDMALCAGPAPYYWGGNWIGVAKKCNSKALAKEFIEFATVRADTMEMYSQITGNFCNNKLAIQSIIEDGAHSNALLKDSQDDFEVLYNVANRLDLKGNVSKYDYYISDCLYYNLFENQTIDELLYAFKYDAQNYVDTYQDKPGLSKITGFKTKTLSSTYATLQWNKNNDATGYEIEKYVGNEKSGDWVNVAKITGNATTSYTVKGLAAGTAGYRFRMRAVKNGAYSDYTSVLTVNTNPYGVGGFKCSSKTSTSVTLKWNKGTTASGYQLQDRKSVV